MKTKHVFIVALLLLIGNFSFELMAQETLKALFKKCETLDNVDMNIVRQRNPETKAVSQVITSVTIKDNPTLVKEFEEAFRKDEPNATQVIENKKNGKLRPSFYQFGRVSFSYSESSSGKVSITMIEN